MSGRIAKNILLSLFFFFLAGFFELGGGYLVWQWLKEGASWYFGLVGGLILFVYGIIPTAQSAYFYKVYSAYGGIFIVMALLWGWVFDGTAPDRFDMIGAALALLGVFFIFYHPKNNEQLWRA